MLQRVGLVIFACSAASTAMADHSPKMPLPFFVNETSPLNTLRVDGVNYTVGQGFPAFYDADNDDNIAHGRTSVASKTNLFWGMKLWKGATVYFNPSLFWGYNISNYLNVASYVNISFPNTSSPNPYMMVQRMFLKQLVDLDGTADQLPLIEGGRSTSLDTQELALTDKVSSNYLTFVIGKYGASDLFDDNIYAHDPTKHFLNGSLTGLSSLQYQGDKWGMSYAATVEWTKNNWSMRAGYFQGARAAPSTNIDTALFNQFMLIGEIEHRHKLGTNPGSIKFIGYRDYGYINNVFEDVSGSLQQQQVPAFLKFGMKKRTKLGIGLNVQQQIAPNFGLFFRAGIDNKSLDFNDITHSLSVGLVVSGAQWNRPLDELGVGAAFNSMKALKVNGINNRFDLGTGAAYFRPEKLLETYYRVGVNSSVEVTADYQFVQNPNYERSRGPAHVFGIRLRSNF